MEMDTKRILTSSQLTKELQLGNLKEGEIYESESYDHAFVIKGGELVGIRNQSILFDQRFIHANWKKRIERIPVAIADVKANVEKDEIVYMENKVTGEITTVTKDTRFGIEELEHARFYIEK